MPESTPCTSQNCTALWAASITATSRESGVRETPWLVVETLQVPPKVSVYRTSPVFADDTWKPSKPEAVVKTAVSAPSRGLAQEHGGSHIPSALVGAHLGSPLFLSKRPLQE
jgi:hypothetical protein